LQYDLHSTLSVLGKDVHTPGVTVRPPPPKCIQRHTTYTSTSISGVDRM